MVKAVTYSLFVFSLLLGSCTKKSISLPDLRETYGAKDKKPFGAYAALQVMKHSFPSNSIQSTSLPFASGMYGYSDTSSLYCCISRNFFIESRDADAILDYVYQGNTFFLSSANIDTLLLNRMYCATEHNGFEERYMPVALRDASVSLIEDANTTKDSFSYFFMPFTTRFSKLNEGYSRILGYNSDGNTNCIVFFWGKGRMFIHTDPRAFSNYFLLTGNNHRYMQQLLQLMPGTPEKIYWNEYYAKQNQRENSDHSAFSEIMKYPPLKMAFWIALGLLLLYVLFSSKRKQRIIRQIKPNTNSSVEFTETIGRLYLQKKDNKNIADKMITYFNEHIRSHYFLSANAGSDDFIRSLSRKSGVPFEHTLSLYRAIEQASGSTVVDDYQLLSLNEQIQQFYKKRK